MWRVSFDQIPGQYEPKAWLRLCPAHPQAEEMLKKNPRMPCATVDRPGGLGHWLGNLLPSLRHHREKAIIPRLEFRRSEVQGGLGTL